MHWSEIVRLVLDGIVALAVAVGAITAVRALTTWKRELRGRTEYELAKRILMSAYRVRNALDSCRRELQVIEPSEDVGVLQKGWKRVVDADRALRAELVEAEAIWGSRLVPCSDALRARVVEYRSNIRVAARVAEDESYADQLPPGKLQAVEAVLWATGEGDDEDAFSTRVKEAILDFDRALRPYLGRRPRGGRWQAAMKRLIPFKAST